MPKKTPVKLSQKFPSTDPLALRLLERLLAFDPKDRPSAEEVYKLQKIFLYFLLYLFPILFQYFGRHWQILISRV